MGDGHAQCAPGPSSAALPSPTGFPKRKITARCCGSTMKKPEMKNTTTSAAMMNFTIQKLLWSASDSAFDPASSGINGTGAFGSSCEWS